MQRMKSLRNQVGGGHYKQFKIEPLEFISSNKLDFLQGNVIKYICRFRDKDGKQDLLKIKHYIDVLLDTEYPELSNDFVSTCDVEDNEQEVEDSWEANWERSMKLAKSESEIAGGGSVDMSQNRIDAINNGINPEKVDEAMEVLKPAHEHFGIVEGEGTQDNYVTWKSESQIKEIVNPYLKMDDLFYDE